MPKTKIDYGNTIIYKISCKDNKVKDVYVGYTTNFIQRKYFHKQNCINRMAVNYDEHLYAIIRKHGGWENWKMENVHVCNCEDYNAAKKMVQEYAVTLRATLNYTILTSSDILLPIMVTETTKPRENTNIKTKNPNSPPCYVCNICDYVTSNKKDYNKHINTIKHNNNKKSPEHNMVCECGKTYTNRSSLFNHRKVCPMTCKDGDNHGEGVSEKVVKGKGEDNLVLQIQEGEKGEKGEKGENDENIKITKDMFLKLINDNQEMIKIIKEQQQQINLIIPKISNAGSTTTNNNTTMNNTNNNFNLNFFLNEKCKDALNMSEFIESLKITLEDLQYSRSNGLVQGISNVMIRGLKELDIYKRPIHCTDVKRDTMYIKDKEKWEKDEKHEKMKNTIIKIANKERNAISAWVDINPDWFDTEEKQMEYLTLVNKVCEPIENDIRNEKKIIKIIGKEIVLNKETEKLLMLK
jgi:hypothetical protein